MPEKSNQEILTEIGLRCISEWIDNNFPKIESYIEDTLKQILEKMEYNIDTVIDKYTTISKIQGKQFPIAKTDNLTLPEKAINILNELENRIEDLWAKYYFLKREIENAEIKEKIITIEKILTLKYTCGLCGKPTEKIIKHHYSYFPEKIIYVCSSCNNRANLESNHPLLNPSIEDANKFYGCDEIESNEENKDSIDANDQRIPANGERAQTSSPNTMGVPDSSEGTK